jgi:hypothetical protein
MLAPLPRKEVHHQHLLAEGRRTKSATRTLISVVVATNQIHAQDDLTYQRHVSSKNHRIAPLSPKKKMVIKETSLKYCEKRGCCKRV